MTQPQSVSGPPDVTDLLLRYLVQRSDAAMAAVEWSGPEVEPYETATGFRIDPRTAWQAATAVLPAGATPAPPPEWAGLVQFSAPQWAIPCAVGEFPQRLRHLQPLLQPAPLTRLIPTPDTPALPGFERLRQWIGQQSAPHLLGAALARLLHDWSDAQRLLPADEANEQATLLWARGQPHDALRLWDAIPERPHVLFNRGLARLFLDQPQAALPLFRQAAALWGERHPWQPLAALYAAIAEIRMAIP
ncbi:MAG: hypothetical protein NZ703_07965 [Gemmataceae bacterium]|nr:hypothetical protein [Gemmataceae bacterium]MCS7271005.1 hypothetical protein [Gemmataceae bacterium]MDW8242755.1 hypothetical protein [Thermogemmata sp.]